MSVSSADILEYQSTAAGSTGGAISGSSVTSGIPNNVWANISDSDRIAGIVVYRKTFWKNTNGTDDMVLPVMFVPNSPTNATLLIGLGIDSADDASPSTEGNMSAFGANAQVALTSSDSGDTRSVTIYGLDGGGNPVAENVTLTGFSEVLSVTTWSKVWAVFVATVNTDTVTVKQGSGGTTRGTINPSTKGCFLWQTAASKGAGIALPNLPASQSYGLWRKLTVSAGAGAVRPDTLTVRIEENS